MFNLLKNLIILGTFSAILAIIFGYLGFLHPAFDTFAHGRLHFSYIVLAGGLLSWFMRARIITLCASIIAIGALTTLSETYLLNQSQLSQRDDRPVYKLLHSNLYWNNPDKAAAFSKIKTLDPDIITLAEFSSRWSSLKKHFSQHGLILFPAQKSESAAAPEYIQNGHYPKPLNFAGEMAA